MRSNLFTRYKLAATAGPIPKAKINVPIPTVPPRYQPIKTTLISIEALTNAMGKLVTLVSPVIRPSRGPGPN